MRRQEFSKVKEVATAWSNVQRFIRSGDQGDLVPVVIPKDKRGYGFLFWFGLALYFLLAGVLTFSIGWIIFGLFMALIFAGIGGMVWWRGAIAEIEQGTTGVLSEWGKIVGTLSPGRNYLWWPWQKVDFIVDTSTEIPYTAPVLSSPTKENVPLKSIEFFLKFQISDAISFVRNIGASNFDTVLASAVQDAIRRRSRMVETAKAYDLRGSDVGDMQEYLNEQLKRYGIRITGANIPDVQLADQYQNNLATRERVAKELVAYEKEWDLMKKRRKDALELEIAKAEKERDAIMIAVSEATNKAREDVALMLQEKEAEAEKIKLDIEAKGRAELKAAENEAKAIQQLGKSYHDNEALLQFDLAGRRLEVAERLVQRAPRPLVVNMPGGGESSALSTLVLAQMLPEAIKNAQSTASGGNGGASTNNGRVRDEAENMLNSLMDEVRKRTGGSSKR